MASVVCCETCIQIMLHGMGNILGESAQVEDGE